MYFYRIKTTSNIFRMFLVLFVFNDVILVLQHRSGIKCKIHLHNCQLYKLYSDVTW